MGTSDFIAGLLGPFFLAVGIAMAVGPDGYRDMAKEFLASRALIFIAGILAFVPGLAIVLTHNVWAPDWRVIVTIIGWLGLIGGAFRLIFPAPVRAIGSALLQDTRWLRGGGVAVATLGAALTYFAFAG
jgi:hypothetical protein